MRPRNERGSEVAGEVAREVGRGRGIIIMNIIMIAYIVLGLYGGAPIEEQRRCSGVALTTGQDQGRPPILNRKTQVSYSSSRGIIAGVGGVGRDRRGGEEVERRPEREQGSSKHEIYEIYKYIWKSYINRMKKHEQESEDRSKANAAGREGRP